MSSNNSSFVVGLTGGIASGKSTVEEELRILGLPVYNTDTMVRSLMKPGLPIFKAVVDRLGSGIVLPSGELNRPHLRKKVFFEESFRLWLESLLHPLIMDEIQKSIQSFEHPFIIIASALMVDTQTGERWPILDRMVTVDIPESLQLESRCLGIQERRIYPCLGNNKACIWPKRIFFSCSLISVDFFFQRK